MLCGREWIICPAKSENMDTWWLDHIFMFDLDSILIKDIKLVEQSFLKNNWVLRFGKKYFIGFEICWKSEYDNIIFQIW